MTVLKCIQCQKFPCNDVNHQVCQIPAIEIKPERIKLLMISEAAPKSPEDYYYVEKGEPLFQQTTLLAFQDAGVPVKSFQDIMKMGIYFTTAVKWGKPDMLSVRRPSPNVHISWRKSWPYFLI
jgi:hypothetical protein